MTNRESALRQIEAGDIFNAEEASGPVRICLTIRVTETTILARSVTTQELIEFNRMTGVAAHFWYSEKYEYVINSTAPLPSDIHDIMLSLDRLFRELEYKRAENPDYEPSWDKPLLNDDQRRGLLFVADFYRAHPLPV